MSEYEIGKEYTILKANQEEIMNRLAYLYNLIELNLKEGKLVEVKKEAK